VTYHEGCEDSSKPDSRDTLDDEQPPPAPDAVQSIHFQNSCGNQSTERIAHLLTNEQGGISLSEFLFGIPATSAVYPCIT
jgi:hypothetical protein